MRTTPHDSKEGRLAWTSVQERADLEAKAKKATPGPWYARYSNKTRNTAIESWPNTGNIGLVHGGLDPDCKADAEHIAAANPTTILALLDDLKEADAECNRLKNDLCEIGTVNDAMHRALVGEAVSDFEESYGDVLLALDTRRECDAYKKAKAENDERFMLERGATK